jgi:response regulator RpfG family c-di-GMP phosphodiesterase
MTDNTKKRITTDELIERMKAGRKRPIDPKFIEEFNELMEKDERMEREQQEGGRKKTARPPEADL